MLLNRGNLQTLFTGFKASFTKGFDNAPSFWNQVAMRTSSGTGEEEYGWVKNLTGLRRWLGDRTINKLALEGFKIKNQPFEHTVSLSTDDIADDKFGVLAPMFEQMGALARQHPDELVFDLLSRGFTELAYDGQLFFDTEHPVTDANGAEISVSNFGGGAGTPWYLIDGTKPIKPLIYQVRRDYDLVRKDDSDDENVFMRREAIYGVDARVNVGFGLWQLAYASKQALDASNYGAARAAMMELTTDGGRKINITPTVLVVPPSLEQTARKLLFGGTRVEPTGAAAPDTTHVAITNEWKDSAQLIVTPFL